jgi:hypothetical protein
MSIPIVQHVWQKSQTQGSARTLLLTLAIHANDCCGVAWVSDTTLRHEVNVSRQRIHELKNAVKATGELIIVERPGYTNLYFVAWQGQPVGGQGSYRAAPRSTHELGYPLRRGMPVKEGEVSGASDTQGSGGSNTPCQASLTQKTRDNDTENEAGSLSPGNGPDGPPTRTLPPDRLECLGLTRNSAAWLAYVSLSQEETAGYQGEPLMTKFKDGDKVKVIDAPEDKQHLVGKIGRVRPPQGFDYDQDLVFVSFDGGVRDGFAEHQLEKVE